MPLAQRSEQAAAGLSLPSEPRRPVDPSAERANISLLRRVQALPTAEPGTAKTSPKSVEVKKTGQGQNIAIGLIDEVSRILPMLVDENETLRAVLNRERERLEADVERATLVACEWRKSAEGAKLQVETLERRLVELGERLERSEARLLSETELAARSARDAAEAECLSSLFEEKLLSSFGAGSLFQTTLDRIRQRAETDVA